MGGGGGGINWTNFPNFPLSKGFCAKTDGELNIFNFMASLRWTDYIIRRQQTVLCDACAVTLLLYKSAEPIHKHGKNKYNAEIQQIPTLKLVPNCVGTGPKGWWKSNSGSTAAEKELQLTSSREPSREKSSKSRATSASLLRLLLIFECFSSRESQRLNSLSTFGSGTVHAFFVLRCLFSCISMSVFTQLTGDGKDHLFTPSNSLSLTITVNFCWIQHESQKSDSTARKPRCTVLSLCFCRPPWSNWYVPYWHSYKTCRVTFTLHVYDLTFISILWRGGDGGGVTDENAAMPLTKGRARVSIFVRRPQDNFWP